MKALLKISLLAALAFGANAAFAQEVDLDVESELGQSKSVESSDLSAATIVEDALEKTPLKISEKRDKSGLFIGPEVGGMINGTLTYSTDAGGGFTRKSDDSDSGGWIVGAKAGARLFVGDVGVRVYGWADYQGGSFKWTIDETDMSATGVGWGADLLYEANLGDYILGGFAGVKMGSREYEFKEKDYGGTISDSVKVTEAVFGIKGESFELSFVLPLGSTKVEKQGRHYTTPARVSNELNSVFYIKLGYMFNWLVF